MLSVLLSACSEQPAPQPATVQDQSDTAAPSPAPTPEPDSIPSNASGNAETDPQEVELHARLGAAQSYLEAATDSARKRYEESMQSCQSLQASDRADCENSAVASEEAELRAARVEFDRRMSEGQ
ncbi:MAG: hypothetical protein AB7E72_01770 [Lysobacterales bacterium]